MTPDLKTFADDPMAFLESLVIPSAHGPQRFAVCMADFQRERFAGIVPAMLSIARGEKPTIGRHWWEATKGASKDSDLAGCLLWMLAFTRRPLTCQVGAADADQADELRKAAKDILALNAWLAGRIEIQSWRIICKATGSECEVITADVAGSHGSRPDVLILNELSHVTKQEFAENLLDNAAKVPHGLAIIATNAGFTGTWQERWREIAATSDRWRMHTYARPAPWLDDAEIDEAQRRNSTARFLRLWWGVWSPNSGDALDEADIRACINPDLGQTFSSSPGWKYVAGLDLGIKHDHAALVVVGLHHKSQRLRLARVESWAPDAATGQVNLIRVEGAVWAAHQHFGLAAVGYDPYQAALMAQRLQLQRVPMLECNFTGANLNLMATTLLEVFRSRRIELFDHPGLIADLGRLTIVEKSYGHRLEAVRDASGHADIATALAIALPMAVEEAGKAKRVVGGFAIGVPRHEKRPFVPISEDQIEFADALYRVSGGARGQKFRPSDYGLS